MPGFDAAELEEMSYDFTKFGGGKDVIPEPDPERVARFWSNYVAMLQRNRIELGQQTKVETGPDGEEESPEQAEERIERIVAASQDLAHRSLDERRRLLADLCGDNPDYDQLTKLPDRVLRAFEAYLQGCLNPEAWSAASTK